MPKDSLTLTELAESIPSVLGTEVYKENDISKHVYNLKYDDSLKVFLYTGKLYILDIEKDNVLSSVETSNGKLTLGSCSEGAFAVGSLKGKKVCIAQYSMNIEPSEYKRIRRDVNMLKIKNKSPELLCDKHTT